MIITPFDYVLSLLYILLFYLIVKKKSRKYDTDLRKYMVTAFFLRMLGSIAYSMLIYYYYGYGDSFKYYQGSEFITDQIKSDLSNTSYLLASSKEAVEWYNMLVGDVGLSGYFAIPSAYLMMKISAVISFLSFNRFLIISLFFGFFSFVGQWKLFLTFDDINKHRHRKLLAYAVLYTPSIWFWGSGLLKDSICLGAIGFIVSILYNLFIKKKFSIFSLLFLVILIYTIFIIKSYIVSIFFISVTILLFNFSIRKVKNIVFRVALIFLLILFTVTLITTLDLSNQISELTQESVTQMEAYRSNYQAALESENSRAGYEIAELDPSILSLLLRSPGIIFNCLFRPFIWESGKVIIFFSALEATLLLFCTFYLLIKLKIRRFFKLIFRDHFVFFCFIISILFALIIGFTTFNFGTMVRYKIILLPFYYFMLVRLYTYYKNLEADPAF